MRMFRLFSMAICLGYANAAASAQACESGYCWGALAAGEDGRAGYAVRVRTAPDAAAQARAVCGESCQVEMFHNSCAALAVNRDGDAFVGTALDRIRAQDAALSQCEVSGGRCVIRVEACSF